MNKQYIINIKKINYDNKYVIIFISNILYIIFYLFRYNYNLYLSTMFFLTYILDKLKIITIIVKH